MKVDRDIIIRLAEDTDFETIFQIWLDGVDNSFDITLFDADVIREEFTKNFNKRIGIFNFWVARNNNEILGWQSLIKTSNNPFRKNLFAESSTYISKHCRLKGVGKMLIDFVMKDAEKSELEFVTGFVSVTNKAARKITKETGWIEVGEMPVSLKSKLLQKKIYLVRPV